jgi:hypothetical protein
VPKRQYDPAKRRAATLRRFGLTPAQYAMILTNQGSHCAICWRKPTTPRALDVDHDHKTGAIRGLLCHRCNRALGYLSDSAALDRAASYVERHTGYFMPKKARKRGPRKATPGSNRRTGS